MKLASFLMGMAGPLALKVLAAIGYTAVTFTGVQVVVNTLIGQAQAHWSAMPTAMLQIASLAGLPEAAGIICGAYLARLAMWQISNATRMIFTGRAA